MSISCRRMSHAVAQNGQVVVHNAKGRHPQVSNGKRLVGQDFVQKDGGHARIAMLGKTVGQHLEQSAAGRGVGIDIDFAKLAVGTHIVHTAHVVVVGMGDEDAVNAPEGQWHDLLTEVGTAVNEQARPWCLDECRTAQSLVVGVGTGAGVALTADGGYATRCSGSKKSQLHTILTSGMDITIPNFSHTSA